MSLDHRHAALERALVVTQRAQLQTRQPEQADGQHQHGHQNLDEAHAALLAQIESMYGFHVSRFPRYEWS